MYLCRYIGSGASSPAFGAVVPKNIIKFVNENDSKSYCLFAVKKSFEMGAPGAPQPSEIDMETLISSNSSVSWLLLDPNFSI